MHIQSLAQFVTLLRVGTWLVPSSLPLVFTRSKDAGCPPNLRYCVDKGTVTQYGSLRKGEKCQGSVPAHQVLRWVSFVIQILFVFQYWSLLLTFLGLIDSGGGDLS